MPFSFGIKSLFSPQDDIQAEIIKEVRKAKKSILMAIYGFHLPPLTDVLIEKHIQGVEVHCILDFSQSEENAEKPEVAKLVEAGIDVVIGTSPKAHQIMHEKALCIDGVHVITGSYNFSTSAAEQVNHMDFIFSRDRAEWFTTFFHDLRAWIVKNEPQDQPKEE